MTKLAIQVYRLLRKRVRSASPRWTYGELAARLPQRVHPRSPRLHAALGEVSLACMHSGLPCLPAIVWRADTRRPSDGYYKVAHPRAHTDEARVAAWEREHASVVRAKARFPTRIA